MKPPGLGKNLASKLKSTQSQSQDALDMSELEISFGASKLDASLDIEDDGKLTMEELKGIRVSMLEFCISLLHFLA